MACYCTQCTLSICAWPFLFSYKCCLYRGRRRSCQNATLSVSGVSGCLLVKRAHCRARSHPTVKETSKRNFRNALQCPGASSPFLSCTCARQHPCLRLPHIPTCWLCDHSRARTPPALNPGWAVWRGNYDKDLSPETSFQPIALQEWISYKLGKSHDWSDGLSGCWEMRRSLANLSLCDCETRY